MTDLEKKHAIAAAALEEYARTGELPDASRLANLVDLTEDQVRAIAPDHAHLRAVCHRFVVQQAAEMAAGVPNYDRFTLQERIGTFVFILLDVLEQHDRFIRLMFPGPLTGPLNSFEGAVRNVLPPILDASDVPSINRVGVTSIPSAAAAANGIVWLVRAWINDGSAEKQRSTALIDRALSLMAASMTNPVPQRGVDLLRYGVEAGYLPLGKLPFIGDWFGVGSDDETASDHESDAPREWE